MRGPTVVCLCGSTRFPQAFELAPLDEYDGHIAAIGDDQPSKGGDAR